jgi:hypothetical protein
MHRRRRRLLVAAAIALIALLVAAEHSGTASHEMADDGMELAAGICLAVLELAVLALVGIPGGVGRLPPAPRRAFAPSGTLTVSNAVLWPQARAGPAALQVFLR